MINPKQPQQEVEEEDYMSEAFLNNLVQQENQDVKAKKANMTYSERRRQKQLEHIANLPKPLHVREKEARTQGLQKEIGEDNKGMAMLLKMGFKKGGTLGARKQSSDSELVPTLSPSNLNAENVAARPEALRVPLAIEIKQGRGGLGMDSERKRQAEEELKRHEEEARLAFDQDFRGQKRDLFDLAKWTRQLTAARSICMRMDSNSARRKTERMEPENQKKVPEESDPAADIEHNQRRRSNPFWWIDDSVSDEILGTSMMGPGAHVENEQDQGVTPELMTSELGDDERRGNDLSHGVEKRIKLDPLQSAEIYEDVVQEEVEEPPKWGERPSFAQLEVREKLDRVVKYLRDEYCYCFWCSALYDSPTDLKEICPGESEDDH